LRWKRPLPGVRTDSRCDEGRRASTAAVPLSCDNLLVSSLIPGAPRLPRLTSR
jgi:hypothetical protein